MSKKSPFIKAVDCLFENIRSGGFTRCPHEQNGEGNCGHDCGCGGCYSHLIDYFKEKADVPDVLDIVKNKYLEYAKKYDRLKEKYETYDSYKMFKNKESRMIMRIELNSYADKANVLEGIMKEAGLEVR